MSVPDSLKAFEQAAVRGRRRMVKEGVLLSPRAMSSRLKVTLQDLDAAVSARCMFTVDVGDKKYFPAFYLSA